MVKIKISHLIKQMRKQERQDAIIQMKKDFFIFHPFAKNNPNYNFKFRTISDKNTIFLITEMNNKEYVVDYYEKLSLNKLIKKYEK